MSGLNVLLKEAFMTLGLLNIPESTVLTRALGTVKLRRCGSIEAAREEETILAVDTGSRSSQQYIPQEDHIMLHSTMGCKTKRWHLEVLQ